MGSEWTQFEIFAVAMTEGESRYGLGTSRVLWLDGQCLITEETSLDCMIDSISYKQKIPI
jgi:hypothetical protein